MHANGATALVVPNVNAFAEGFDIPTDEFYQSSPSAKSPRAYSTR